jgi:hypothetical protein
MEISGWNTVDIAISQVGMTKNSETSIYVYWFIYILLLIIICSAGVWTQGLVLDGQFALTLKTHP